MNDTDVSDDATIIDAEIIAGPTKGSNVIMAQGYTPPLDGSYDPYAAMDGRIAKAVARVLQSVYLGYEWKVVSEVKQGMVAFQLHELMGDTLHVFIKLADYNDLSDKLVLKLAGDLLERMGLPRGYCDMERYNEAKTRRHTFQFDDRKLA